MPSRFLSPFPTFTHHVPNMLHLQAQGVLPSHIRRALDERGIKYGREGK